MLPPAVFPYHSDCSTLLYSASLHTIFAGDRSMFLANVLHRNVEIGSPNAALPHTL